MDRFGHPRVLRVVALAHGTAVATLVVPAERAAPTLLLSVCGGRRNEPANEAPDGLCLGGMPLEHINPDGLARPEIYSHVVVTAGNRLVLVAGRVAEDEGAT